MRILGYLLHVLYRFLILFIYLCAMPIQLTKDLINFLNEVLATLDIYLDELIIFLEKLDPKLENEINELFKNKG